MNKKLKKLKNILTRFEKELNLFPSFVGNN